MKAHDVYRSRHFGDVTRLFRDAEYDIDYEWPWPILVDASDVAPLLYDPDVKTPPDLSKLVIKPPYDRMFIEYAVDVPAGDGPSPYGNFDPGRLNRAYHYQAGVAVSCAFDPDGLGDEVEPYIKGRGIEPGVAVCGLMRTDVYTRYRRDVEHTGSTSILLDAYGMGVGKLNILPSQLALAMREQFVARGAMTADKWRVWLADLVKMTQGGALFTLGLMNCRNVKIVDRKETRQQRRQRERSGGVVYKTLHIKPMKERRVSNESGDGSHASPGWHLRSHSFRDYRNGPGLFGKWKDVFYFGPTTVGDPSRKIHKKLVIEQGD